MPVRSHQVGIKFLNFAINTLWEGSAKITKGKDLVPKAVVHIDGNVLPDEVLSQLGSSSDKIVFMYTGKTALHHEDENTLCDEMILGV